MSIGKEKAVPEPVGGTTEEQPIQICNEVSVTELKQEINDETVSAEEKLSEHSRPSTTDGLLCSDTYLFASAPKVGKSFLMAQLAYYVSTGQKLWDYDVHQGTVLYLALEDDYQRLQERMYHMFGVEGTDKLHFAVAAKQLGNGLDGSLKSLCVSIRIRN